ncbi:MAG: hypothetical protein Q8N43_02975 [Candidatus Azambacteria bacterium]|nr:hypothetical protein [Candidatus Azambacteria bacterium]
MPELTREEKLKLVEKLPQQLQDFLYSEDTGAFLLYLGQKYNLPDEKVRLLSKLAGDVVLGIVPITSLAQEINSKITSDIQAAMHLAQELNIELLAPVMAPMPAPATPKREIASPTPTIDQYRELAPSVPEIIDLRKMPPAVSKVEPPPSAPPAPIMPVPKIQAVPLAPAPAPSLLPKPITAPPILPTLSPTSSEQQSRGSSIPQPNLRDLGGIGTTPPAKPAPQPPLIEAEPHQKPIDAYREPQPQYIMRPSGAPPTDSPENVLDLRKDKGEF